MLWMDSMNNLLLIVWSDKLELGIPIVDEQHRTIVSTMNSLYFLLSKNLFNESILHISRIVINHIKLHNFTEEYILEQAHYPDLDGHRKQHRESELDLMEAVRKTTQAYEQNALRSDELMAFMKSYWLNHICKEDRKYADWMRRQGV